MKGWLINILHEDDQLLVVDKIPGDFVHPSRLDRTVTTSVLQQAEELVGQKLFPAHRLDRPTSGVLIFAKNREAASHLGQQFLNRSVGKRYLALVRGWVGASFCQFNPLRHPDSREYVSAMTEFRPLKYYEFPVAVAPHPSLRCTLIEAKPLTGRYHQIRRHLKSASHPIVGDTKYGQGKINLYFRESLNLPELFLHCSALAFDHPSGSCCQVVSQIPKRFTELKGFERVSE